MKTSAFVLSAFLAVAFSACQSSDRARTCQQFKEGNFFYHSYNLRGKTTFLVNRQGDVQTEANQATGTTSRLAIEWTGDCTYELRLLESTEHLPKVMEAIRKKAVFKNEIVGSTSDYYLFKVTRDSITYPATDTLWLKK